MKLRQILKCFPGGKHKALTLSYDDGRAADRRLAQLLREHGMKGTFHLNSGLIGTGDRISAGEVNKVYEGHEVSLHTVTHPTSERVPKEQLIHEFMEDRKALEGITGCTVRGLSYPNGSYNKAIKAMLPHLGIEYARTVKSTASFAMPDDLHEWHPTCHHNDRLLELADDFIALGKRQYLYLMYVWGHSYEFDQQNNWDRIERFCDKVGGRDDIWYATNIEIVDDMRAFERLHFSADCSFVYNPSAASVWLSVDGHMIEARGGEYTRLA